MADQDIEAAIRATAHNEVLITGGVDNGKPSVDATVERDWTKGAAGVTATVSSPTSTSPSTWSVRGFVKWMFGER